MTANLTAHLTKEELTDNLLGVSSLTVNAHLLSCPACANELARVKASIANFRSAAHAWSEHAIVAAESRTARVHAVRERPWAARWMLVAAGLLLCAAASVTYLYQERTVSQSHPAPVSTATASAGLSQAQLDQDNELLSQVSGELSESVPAPMQPLLVSESVGSGAANTQVLK